MATDRDISTAGIADGLRKLRGRWRMLCVSAFALWVAGSSALALCVALAVGSALPRSIGPLLLLAWLSASAYGAVRVWSRTLGTRPGLDGVAARVEDTRPRARRALRPQPRHDTSDACGQPWCLPCGWPSSQPHV